MISGSVRDAVKPITNVAARGLLSVWLRVRGSHDVQSSTIHGRSSTGRIPGCNRTPLLPIYDPDESLLDGGVHTRWLGGSAAAAPLEDVASAAYDLNSDAVP